MKRDPFFFMIYYVIPSVLFVICAYCSFWVDPAQPPARCGLAITTILITINFTNGITNILPPIDQSIWLEEYFTGVLVFTCISMFEYAALNFAMVHYNAYRTEIEAAIVGVKGNLTTLKNKVSKNQSE